MKTHLEKQVAIKVFDERDMVDRDYNDIYIGDDEVVHWYFYREPESDVPQGSMDVAENCPE